VELQLSSRAVRQGMIVAVVEGSLYSVWFALIGNNYLTGFLLHLGATNAQIGLTAALQPLSSLAMILAAYIMAQLPARKPFLMTTAYTHRILWSLTGFLPLVLARGAWVWTYLAVYFVANLAISLGVPAWQSMMADMVPADMRGRYFGGRSAVAQAVMVSVTLLAGRYLDAHPGYAGFRGLYTVALVFGMMNVTCFFLQPEPPYLRRQPESLRSHLALPWRDRAFRRTVLFGAALTMAGGVVTPFYAVRMLKEMHLSYTLVSQVAATATVAGIVAFMGLGRVLDRVGEVRTLNVLPVLYMVVPLLWFAIGPSSLVLLFLANALQGALVAAQALALTNLSYRMSPRADRPMYLAVFAAAAGLGGFAAPIVGGWLSGSFGFSMLLAVSAVAYLAVAGYWWSRVRPAVAESLAVQKEE
jgi:MFS family permease